MTDFLQSGIKQKLPGLSSEYIILFEQTLIYVTVLGLTAVLQCICQGKAKFYTLRIAGRTDKLLPYGPYFLQTT